MRITQNGMKRQYLRNSNSALERMNSINNRILTERKFMRASDDSTAAANAMIIRKSLSNLDMYEDNLKKVQALYNSAESHLSTLTSTVSKTITQVIYGINGDKSQTERNIIAGELEQFAEQMRTELNEVYADRRIFGGTNNNDVSFTFDTATRQVSYNGVPVSAEIIEKDDGSGGKTYSFGFKDGVVSPITYDDDENAVTPTPKLPADVSATLTAEQITDYEEGRLKSYDLYPGSQPIYVDVGIGIKYDYDDPNDLTTAKVNPDTAMNITLNGVDMTGCGTDQDGDSLNVIQLAYDAAEAMRNGDVKTCNRLIDKLHSAEEQVLISITEFGAKSESINFHLTKIDNDRYNLQVQQKDIEAADLTKEITDFKSAQAAYNATLQMGSSVIPNSIFDFIR
ncbi:MAG: flagellar hook-associated protein FlgL [Ruminococcus sp.]|nr:flagellar hook-associated protein FlgL [Ruminococcus sp.]